MNEYQEALNRVEKRVFKYTAKLSLLNHIRMRLDKFVSADELMLMIFEDHKQTVFKNEMQKLTETATELGITPEQYLIKLSKKKSK